MKPFNLELVKSGHPVCTRDGRPVRIICFDREDTDHYPIIALLKNEDGSERVLTFNERGKFLQNDTVSEYDLFMVGEKKTGWINIYADCVGCCSTGYNIYGSKQEAIATSIKDDVIDTIQIEFEI